MGGSWHVRVSLGATARWVRNLGTLDPSTAFGPAAPPLPPRVFPPTPEIAALLVDHESVVRAPGRGNDGEKETEESTQARVLSAVRHAATMSRTRIKIGRAPMRLDADKPVWEG